MTDPREVTVGLLHDVGLCYTGYAGLAVGSGIFESRSAYPACADLRCHLEIHGQFAGKFYALAAKSILAFSIFSEECPVYVLFRHLHRSDIGVQIQFAAQSYIGAFQISALWRRGRALQQHITVFDLCKHFLRHGLHCLQPIADGEAVYGFQHHPAVIQFLLQQQVQHSDRLIHDDRPDAVTGTDADGDRRKFLEILGFSVIRLHHHDPGQLVHEQASELTADVADNGHFIHFLDAHIDDLAHSALFLSFSIFLFNQYCEPPPQHISAVRRPAGSFSACR